MRPWVYGLLVSGALLGASAPGSAQVRLSGAGGSSYPLGDLADLFGRGWHVLASVGLSLPLAPFGLRIDAAYNRFENGAEDFRTVSGTLNGIVNLPAVLVGPYLIGGAGTYYNRTSDRGLSGSLGETTNFGLNLGAGLRLTVPGAAIFVETRLHHIFTEDGALRYVPVSGGIRF